MADRPNDEIESIITGRLLPIVQLHADKELQKQLLPVVDLGNDEPPITIVRDAKSAQKALFHQILLTTAVLVLAAGCGMPIGYSAVIVPQLYNSNDSLQMDLEFGSWFASIHSLAAPVGTFVSGPLMDYYGRRPTMMLSIVPLVLGWTLLATATSHMILLIGRMLAGMSVGLMSAPSQILIAECAEPKIRGFLIGVPFVSYSLGILCTYSLGVILHWRNVAWCGIILPAISMVAIFFSPDSPVWLARKGYLERAESALRWLRCSESMAKSELHDILKRNKAECENSSPDESIWTICAKVAVLKPLFIINGFQVTLILSGTYLVVFYAVDIISELGSDVNSMTAAVYTAIVRLIFTVVSCVLLFNVKRRTMIVSAGFGAGISTVLLAAFMYARLGAPKTPIDLYVAAVCILVYIASTTVFMVMPGVMIGELLPARVRGRVGGYIFTAFNVGFFVVAKCFPFLNQKLKMQGIFLLFGTASLAASFLMFLLLPETKGRTLGEIEDYFQGKNWLWMSRKDKSKQPLNA